MNIFQRGLLGEVVHDHFSQGCKIRMEQNMPLLFRQFADLEAPRFQFRKELQRDPGFQTDNIIQKEEYRVPSARMRSSRNTSKCS